MAWWVPIVMKGMEMGANEISRRQGNKELAEDKKVVDAQLQQAAGAYSGTSGQSSYTREGGGVPGSVYGAMAQNWARQEEDFDLAGAVLGAAEGGFAAYEQYDYEKTQAADKESLKNMMGETWDDKASVEVNMLRFVMGTRKDRDIDDGDAPETKDKELPKNTVETNLEGTQFGERRSGQKKGLGSTIGVESGMRNYLEGLPREASPVASLDVVAQKQERQKFNWQSFTAWLKRYRSGNVDISDMGGF